MLWNSDLCYYNHKWIRIAEWMNPSIAEWIILSIPEWIIPSIAAEWMNPSIAEWMNPNKMIHCSSNRLI